MKVTREQWQYADGAKVWVGRYRNCKNELHWHYDCELLFVECGSLNIFCNYTSYTVCEGQALFIDSEQVHFINTITPDAIVKVIIFDYDIIKAFTEKLTLSSALLSTDYGISELYEQLKRELRERSPFWDYNTANLISLLAVNIFRNEQREPKSKNDRTAKRLKNLLTEIDEKFEYYDLGAAAEFMFMNPTYFSRLFHKLTGITFSQYLNFVKCEKAVELLKAEPDTLITEISLRCGFSTIRNFNRIFKEFTGYTPKNLPKDFIMKEIFTNLNEYSANPTSAESELIESSDD